jgi:type IV pilus assembly protein PilV
MKTSNRKSQSGVFLLEALIGIIIFSIGILTMIALQTNAIAVQADAQYRIEAANLADRMLGEISLNVNRANSAALQTSLVSFAHRTTTTAPCNYTGSDSTNTRVTNWVTAINTTAATRLPGSSASMQQILVDTSTFNRVAITVCWQSPADAVPRRHTLVSYIN